MAVGDAYVFLGFLAPLLTQLFFPKPLPTFLTCFCRKEKSPQPGSLTRSPLSHPGGTPEKENLWKTLWEKEKNAGNKQILISPPCFLPYQRQKTSFELHSYGIQQLLSIWTNLKFCRYSYLL